MKPMSVSYKPDSNATGAEILEGLNTAADAIREMSRRGDEARAAWMALEPRRAKILRLALAWEAVRRHPGRSKLANPGTRKKRGGGHKRRSATTRKTS